MTIIILSNKINANYLKVIIVQYNKLLFIKFYYAILI